MKNKLIDKNEKELKIGESDPKERKAMSQFPDEPNQSITQCHGRCNVTGLDIDEWLKDEAEQFADIERYEAALKNSHPVSAPQNFLAPQGNVLDVFLAPQGNDLQGFLAPQVTVPQHVLDHVPAKYDPITMPCYPKLNNIALLNDFFESSNLTVPQKRVRWTREEQRLLGNWKEVSNFVGSETSSQVASHADNHKKVSEKKRKRESIHDTALQDTDMNMILLPHIDRQNWVSIPNFAMQQPYDLDLAVQQFYKRQ